MKIYIEDNIQEVTSEELEQLIDRLPDWRREKALAFRHEQGRKECAISYLLLCRALKEVYGIEEQPKFVIGEHGKPELAFSSYEKGYLPHFNMSHCKKAVACVVSDEEVGIDIEKTGRYSEATARHVLNDEEYNNVVSSSNPDLEFTKYWTIKEAIVKLTGRGIDDDLKNLLIKYKDVDVCTEVHEEKGYVVSVARFLEGL